VLCPHPLPGIGPTLRLAWLAEAKALEGTTGGPYGRNADDASWSSPLVAHIDRAPEGSSMPRPACAGVKLPRENVDALAITKYPPIAQAATLCYSRRYGAFTRIREH
jgi:hypothetical protein